MKQDATKGKPGTAAKKPVEPAAKVREAVRQVERLVRTIRSAHSAACEQNPLLAMVLLGRLESAATLQRKLGEIETCLRG